jgi:hypothetical protein
MPKNLAVMTPLEAINFSIEEAAYNRKDATDDECLKYYGTIETVLTKLEDDIIKFLHKEIDGEELRKRIDVLTAY